MDLELHRYGSHALLVSFSGALDEAAFDRQRRLLSALERHAPAGLLEIVPSFTRILLVFSDPSRCDSAVSGLAGIGIDLEYDAGPDPGRLVELPVAYGGPDLERVAQNAGLSPQDVVSAHAAPEYLVHCLGFSPGFPYLGGLDRRLVTPRLATPRVRVPSGSVAIGGAHTGVYSVTGPGGWNLVGATTVTIFSPWAATLREQFAVMPGDRIRFVPQGWRESVDWIKEPVPRKASEEVEAAVSGVGPVLRILSSGLGITIQDAGRPGFRSLGVPPGGAMDPSAARWANRLLDNPPEWPVLECCLQGQRIEVMETGWVAITGGRGMGSGQRAGWSAVRVRAGDVMEFPPMQRGVWRYLAIPGGVAAPRFLGSASTLPRAGIGSPINVGRTICRSAAAAFSPPEATATRRVPWSEVPDAASDVILPVWPGPQWSWFPEGARELFFRAEWRVSSQCDRSGYRLLGPGIHPDLRDMTSEPVLQGTIQVPPGGMPIVTMPDGPTLGGYPKLGMIESEDLWRLAQCGPGHRVRFVCAV